MKKFINLFICFLLLFMATSLIAQEDATAADATEEIAAIISVPDGSTLKSEEDFKTHKKTFLETVDWLNGIPLNDYMKREKPTRFAYFWSIGNPVAYPDIKMECISFIEKEPSYVYGSDLMMTYAMNMVKYKIDKGDTATEKDAQIAGMKAMVSAYQTLEDEKEKSKSMDAYVDLIERGDLGSFLDNILKEKK